MKSTTERTTLLAIDSATEYCSVALQSDDRVCIRGQEAPRQHANLLLPYVQEVLADAGVSLADVGAIAVGSGPGSFTGVRIAAGIAQGLAFSQQIPLIGVSSLLAMAQQAYRKYGVTHVAAAIDARMGEVYWGTCTLENGLMVMQAPPRVCPPEQVSLPVQDTDIQWFGVGTGFETYLQALTEALAPARVMHLQDVRFPHAEDMLVLARSAWQKGNVVNADQFDVEYVRNEVTWQKLPGRE
ncbi:tRNA (adenosine(37)-N6)-threonylcarbamoyltransferase complex dimerization subunit type 1 TsaB [Aliidiomarina halalkaliphila]|uniref:tRNA threonylcarbamoyladenosine biosynthesis protein TsaB n=1 Tax=Aliidiomarina halalkaliphila TaxID=2593535 RepID=A0A552X503_9GAMM|nr:tRNA (adenosine(37)-N6)-threonylcarbamoyltransferase complex dimerization subunit type 1 TsaB [Aliidiomarina halalkaliphila]TRW50101.1 tRNA (adenosine(37)-N6)-threonylcarbamoyltransferase complex dimerization subunit type 1 TsaB [Aliidiomarina halalkaliphila]